MALENKKWLAVIKLPGAIIAAANGTAFCLQQLWNGLFPDQAVSKQCVLTFMAISVLLVVGGFIAEHVIKGQTKPEPGKDDKDKGEDDPKKTHRKTFEDHIQEARRDAARQRTQTRNS